MLWGHDAGGTGQGGSSATPSPANNTNASLPAAAAASAAAAAGPVLPPALSLIPADADCHLRDSNPEAGGAGGAGGGAGAGGGTSGTLVWVYAGRYSVVNGSDVMGRLAGGVYQVCARASGSAGRGSYMI